MNAKELFEEIRNYCRTNSNDALVKKYSRYFKEGYDAYGLSREQLENKVKSIISGKNVTLKLMLNTARYLIKGVKYEETSFAICLVREFSKEFDAATFHEIEKWFDEGITNWAHTDIICGELIPLFFEKNIISLNDLSAWRSAANKFKRRAVPVAMIKLLKSNTDYTSLFVFIDPLMEDSERVVQQGLGWFLREAWKLKKKETEAFLLKWKNRAGRVIVQYATEKMTPEEKKRFKREK